MARRVCLPWIETWSAYGHDLFHEALAQIFRSWGFEVDTPHRSEAQPETYGVDDLVLFLDNPCSTAFDRLQEERGPTRAKRVFFNMDPPKKRHLLWVEHFQYDLILDYNVPTARLWNERNSRNRTRAEYCGMGYHESYEESVQEPRQGAPMLFMMSGPNKRRSQVWAQIKDVTIPLGHDCDWVDHRTSRADTLTHVGRDGIHLNLLRDELRGRKTFGWMRILLFHAMSRAFVLSEPLHWYPHGMESGRHWVVAAIKDLPSAAAYWMDRPEERKAIGQAGYEFFRDHHRLEDHLRRALEKGGLL